MSETPKARRLPSTMLLGVLMLAPIYGTFAILLVILTFVGWPRIDTFVAPVLEQQRVFDVTYDVPDRKLCWTWEFSKVREAKATVVAFSVQDRDGDHATIFPYRADTGVAFDPRAPTRRPGRHRVPLCALLPEGIESPWVATGFIDYETTKWWTTRATSPEIAPAGAKATVGNGG